MSGAVDAVIHRGDDGAAVRAKDSLKSLYLSHAGSPLKGNVNGYINFFYHIPFRAGRATYFLSELSCGDGNEDAIVVLPQDKQPNCLRGIQTGE